MRMTARVREIISSNAVDHYLPLVVQADKPQVFPMYFAKIMKEDVIAFPVTNATDIDGVLHKTIPAMVMVADRDAGYEAYLLEGKARYVTDKLDYELIAEMRNVVPEFPIHGAIVFEAENVHLIPPP